MSELMRPSRITICPSFSCPGAGTSPDRHWQFGWSRSSTFSYRFWWSVCHVVFFFFTSTPVSAAAFSQHYGQPATAPIAGEVVQQPSVNVVALHQSVMGSSAPPFVPTAVTPVELRGHSGYDGAAQHLAVHSVAPHILLDVVSQMNTKPLSHLMEARISRKCLWFPLGRFCWRCQ